MGETGKRTWCEVNLDHLASNVRLLQQRCGKPLMAVVKADAYGHGDVVVARFLQEHGITRFAVSNIEEAVTLRKAGIQGMLLILGYTPPADADRLVQHQITQTVYSFSYGKKLAAQLATLGAVLPVHIKLDTGMHRIGFDAQKTEQTVTEILELASLPCFAMEGIFTHLCHADTAVEDAVAYTKAQLQAFDRTVQALEQAGLHFAVRHTQNSAGIWNLSDCRYDMVRAGISMYGLDPNDATVEPAPLRQVMSLKSVITMLKTLEAGQAVSYGRTFTTQGVTKVATVAVGYADGYARQLSGRGDVLIHGVRCPIIGRVCMDQLMVDVTHLPQAAEGDTVTLFGWDEQELLPLGELAETIATIHYELACHVSRRVPRVYLWQGKVVDEVRYW